VLLLYIIVDIYLLYPGYLGSIYKFGSQELKAAFVHKYSVTLPLLGQKHEFTSSVSHYGKLHMLIKLS